MKTEEDQEETLEGWESRADEAPPQVAENSTGGNQIWILVGQINRQIKKQMKNRPKRQMTVSDYWLEP